jgi:RNase P/RNase MRP subunit p30
MFTDLVLCKEQLLDLGFDKVMNVNLIDFNTKKDLQKKLSQEKGLRVVIGSRNNRTAIESKKIDVLLSPERGIKKDSFHYRNSGLDHAICTLAKNNNITIGFNFNDVLISQGVLRAGNLGRMMQNVRLCRKHKIRMLIGSFAQDKWQMRSRNDLISFGIVLGMHPEEAQKSLQVVKEIGKERREKKLLVTEGVRILK